MSGGVGPSIDIVKCTGSNHRTLCKWHATSPHADPPVFGETNKILSIYVFFGAVIGLFVPIAYILEGFFEGDKEGINAAAPHVFLLSSQIFMEGLSFSEYGGSSRRLYIGRALAIANMAFWCFNLFGFLLPVFLPKAFKRYYSYKKIKD
ncbi:unnamed protein product [Fraxinus pennsylvanica]|uniref:DUF7733 domain-containing protein n=1 Tax=Fraxinus pennsylvanica TaxID=56036 RepID=A0AAD2E2V7_9LAMI|nr:unnamed protein product [Fraxinus pennsylvanica]